MQDDLHLVGNMYDWLLTIFCKWSEQLDPFGMLPLNGR